MDEEEKTKWIEVSAVWDYGSVDVVCSSLCLRAIWSLSVGFGSLEFGFYCGYIPPSRTLMNIFIPVPPCHCLFSTYTGHECGTTVK